MGWSAEGIARSVSRKQIFLSRAPCPFFFLHILSAVLPWIISWQLKTPLHLVSLKVSFTFGWQMSHLLFQGNVVNIIVKTWQRSSLWIIYRYVVSELKVLCSVIFNQTPCRFTENTELSIVLLLRSSCYNSNIENSKSWNFLCVMSRNWCMKVYLLCTVCTFALKQISIDTIHNYKHSEILQRENPDKYILGQNVSLEV